VKIDDSSIIVEMKFGSHLYGTSTPESDLDFKGIYMPSEWDMFLGRVKKSISENTKTSQVEGDKNTAEDVDREFYSLQYFVKLACEGQTVALDMLHAPDDCIITTSVIWEELVAHRKQFYTRNLSAFVGYAQKQAAKYGIKGSRLNDVQKVIDFLDREPVRFNITGEAHRLGRWWEELPDGEHISKTGKCYDRNDHLHPAVYEVCGKKIQETASVDYALDILKRYHKQYGERAKKAARSEGVDWKAMSHALRAAYQVEEILTEDGITFPLKMAGYLKIVKAGIFDYPSVAEELEEQIAKVKKLVAMSDLPEEVNIDMWERWLVSTLQRGME